MPAALHYAIIAACMAVVIYAGLPQHARPAKARARIRRHR